VRRYVSFRDFDWVLLTFVLLICLIGVAQIYSATLHTKFAGAYIKQLYWIAGGLALMFLISLVNYAAYELPRFASSPIRDARAPQNLVPIGALEDELKRRMGDPLLIRRAIEQRIAEGVSV